MCGPLRAAPLQQGPSGAGTPHAREAGHVGEADAAGQEPQCPPQTACRGSAPSATGHMHTDSRGLGGGQAAQTKRWLLSQGLQVRGWASGSRILGPAGTCAHQASSMKCSQGHGEGVRPPDPPLHPGHRPLQGDTQGAGPGLRDIEAHEPGARATIPGLPALQ